MEEICKVKKLCSDFTCSLTFSMQWALELQPFSLKPLLRRAMANESLEKYRQAYVDYKVALQLDSTMLLANDSINRITRTLIDLDGPNWREKLPPIPSVPVSIQLQHQEKNMAATTNARPERGTDVQKAVTDTLHKEGKPQKIIAKEAGCLQSAVSKHINGKLSGRKACGRKRCTSNRDNRSLERTVKKRPFKNVREILKEWTAAGVIASRATTHRCIQDMGYKCHIPSVKPLMTNRQHQKCLTWAKEKKNWTVAQWSKVFSDESKFCISFGNQGLRVWRKSGEATIQAA
ncbi:unnamed protein product [Ranitomeya imitator]|uniref:Transposase Tc1-like domain-containing protein n=1 Tax=Ranitomeya imitator TaxID=111125 RepID=A0ABN9KRK0_9NEOB|nr:unnamed protein product [Ranitomeya imitator]